MAAVARLHLDPERVIGDVSPLLFGGFAEHLGRCIYQGIFDPDGPQADEQGFRQDVLAALRELGYTTIRWPGGNFVSGYHWRDGVGPAAERPRRRDLAWQSVESNRFGTDEFIAFCRAIAAEPMIAVNLGTGSLDEAAAWVEYCNAPAGTAWADLRAANGHRQPHGVKYWCLGNEMDGPWQMGHLSAEAYGAKAREAAKLMRWHDPALKLVLCGSSGPQMATYPEWDRVTLEACWEQVDYLAMHYYTTNADDDTGSYLAMTAQFESHVETLAAVLRYVRARQRSSKQVYLSWDEWNIWHRSAASRGEWQEAPHLLECTYNVEDALVAAQWLNVFLRHCDVLKIACVAQIVNVIAPIMTNAGGLFKQTIFHPFAAWRRHATGQALDVRVEAPTYETRRFGDQPLLDAAATRDPETGRQAIFLVHRGHKEPLSLEVHWSNQAPARLVECWQLAGSDPKAHNSFAEPEAVAPRTPPPPSVENARARVDLPPLSITVLAT